MQYNKRKMDVIMSLQIWDNLYIFMETAVDRNLATVLP